jgi:hypothetical protein
MTSNELRRRILLPLYELYLKGGNGPMAEPKLMTSSGANDEVQFREELRFLHDEGYVEGTPVPFQPHGYLKSVSLTRKGAHLMDTPGELDRQFPVGPVNQVTDLFLHQMRIEFEKSDLSDDEKEQFFLLLEKFAANPKAAAILFNVLNRCFLPQT